MLELILGPMMSGKSTMLMTHIGEHTLVVNHVFDTRTGNSIKTHNGKEAPAVKCRSLSTLSVPPSIKKVLIDEGQFFDDIECAESLAEHVVVAGLNSDYKKRPFGKILNLVARASNVIFLKATCACGAEAPFTKRISNEKNIISVDSKYIPVCEKCYIS